MTPEMVELEQAVVGKTVASIEKSSGVIKLRLSDNTTVEFWSEDLYVGIIFPRYIRAEFSERE